MVPIPGVAFSAASVPSKIPDGEGEGEAGLGVGCTEREQLTQQLSNLSINSALFSALSSIAWNDERPLAICTTPATISAAYSLILTLTDGILENSIYKCWSSK